MARLLDLPPDLLVSILDFLSRKEHHALTHTCWLTNKAAIPRLYRDFKFAATGSGTCTRRLALLLRTLLDRPELASHVVSVRLSGAQPCWNKCDSWLREGSRSASVKLWGLDDCPTMSKAQLIFASNLFYQFVDDNMQQSQTQFRGRCTDALVTLMLTRFTGLQSLDLGDGFLRYSLFLPQLLKRTDYLFPKLRHAVLGDKTLDSSSSVSYMDLNPIRPIFYSSTVTSFECSMSQPWRFHWTDKPPASQTLTSLTLFRTNISRATLGDLLSATPQLTYLHFEHEFLFNASTPTNPSLSPYLNLSELNTALYHVKNTLQECHLILRLGPGSISTTEYPLASVRFPPIQGTLTMLKFMPRLRNAEVPLIMLLGWYPDFAARLEEVLPLGLADLVLRDDLVRYCPWVAPSNAEKKVLRIGSYIQDRAVHARRLQRLRVRLTSAKCSLMHAVGALNISTTASGVRTSLVRGKKSETYGWRFDTEGRDSERFDAKCRDHGLLVPGNAVRTDSVLRSASLVCEEGWEEPGSF